MNMASTIATKLVNLEGLSFEVLSENQDAAWYQQRKAYEEKVSLLYRFIRDEEFDQFIDVGANVGLISVLANLAAPFLNCIALEADPRLAELVRRNLRRHQLDKVQVINAIVGQENRSESYFSINPSGSLDNRVNMPGWEQVQVPMIRLDTVLNEQKVTGKTFIKIDTQGYEFGVLRGSESWLKSNQSWFIKMEFAPDWLRSQGSSPIELLQYLVGECGYQVVEFPERIAFGTPNLSSLFATPLKSEQCDEFVNYVSSLNKGGRGWIDLLVRP